MPDAPEEEQPAGEPPLRFSNEAKLRKQMRKRGWTEQEVREALATSGIPSQGKHGPAMRHVHPHTGKSVVVDVATGEVFHVGEKATSMSETVYVALLDEGTAVWRPAPARKVGDSAYEILRPADYDPETETWEFAPGSVVQCEPRSTPGGERLTAVRLLEPNRRTA